MGPARRPRRRAARSACRGQRLRLQLPRAPVAGRRRRPVGPGRAGADRAAQRVRRGGRGRVALGARGRRGAGRVRGRRGARGAAHDRLRELRDLRPERSGAREPVQPDLAARGARGVAVGRLPPRPGRWRRSRRRLRARRGAGSGGARLRAHLVAAPPRAGGAGGAGRRGAPDRVRPRCRHALPGGEGDSPRGAAGDAGLGAGPVQPRAPDPGQRRERSRRQAHGGREGGDRPPRGAGPRNPRGRLRARRRGLRPARPRQRPGGAALLFPGPDRAAAAAGLDPRPGSAEPARRARSRLPRLGASRRTGVRRGRR